MRHRSIEQMEMEMSAWYQKRAAAEWPGCGVQWAPRSCSHQAAWPLSLWSRWVHTQAMPRREDCFPRDRQTEPKEWERERWGHTGPGPSELSPGQGV